MKSLRLTSLAFLLVAVAVANAADPKDVSGKAKKKPASSPTPAASSLPDPVAVVDGTPITKAELEKEFASALASAGKPSSELTAQQKEQGYHAILDDMVVDRLLRKSSADVKVDDADVNKTVDQIKSQFPSEDKMNEELKKNGQTLDKVKENIRISLREQKWIESQIADKTAVTDEDAKSFYDKNTDKFKMADSVRASHILFAVPPDAKPDVVADKEKLAKKTAERIKKGEDFAKLATELSDDPGSKVAGGDLNFFTKERMVPEFADAAFKLKVGEVSEPVKTQYGFHIIKVTDKKDARTVPFDEAKEKITAYLKETKKREAVTELLASVRAKADVKINLAPLPKADVMPQLPTGLPGQP